MIPYGQQFSSSSTSDAQIQSSEENRTAKIPRLQDNDSTVGEPVRKLSEAAAKAGIMRLQSALGILTVPDQETLQPKDRKYLSKKSVNQDVTTLLKQKQDFMVRCLRGDNPHDFVRFDRTVPLFRAGMQQIKENYARWDSVQSSDGELKARIEMQHANLAMLAKHLKAAAAGNEPVLSQLTLPQEPSIISDDLDCPIMAGNFSCFSNPAYFTGEKVFDETGLKVEITQEIDKIRKVMPQLTHPQIRGEFPISKKAIELQAGVFEAERLAKEWANSVGDLDPYTKIESEHSFFDPTYIVTMKALKRMAGADNETVAFYKYSVHEMSKFIMKKLMWDAAVILGKEDQFVPTKLTAVFPDDDSQTEVDGVIQPMQKGQLLADILKNSEHGDAGIDRISLVSSVLTAVVFGMFGKRNILIDPSGKPKFFNNTLCMPHSNDLLDNVDEFVSPFSCDLLAVPGSSQPLTVSEIVQLRSELAAIEGKLGELGKYFKSKHVAAQVSQLLPGWMFPEDSLKAMRARIDALKDILANPKNNLSLNDLALDAIPGYKLWTAIRTVYFENFDGVKIANALRRFYQEEYGDDHPTIDLNEIAEEYKKFFINPFLMAGVYHSDFTSTRALLENPSGSLEEMINRIKLAIREQEEGHSSGPRIVSRAVTKLAVDCKGKPDQLIRPFLYEYMYRVLDVIKGNFPIHKIYQNERTRQEMNEKLSNLNKGEYMFLSATDSAKDPLQPKIFLLTKEKSGSRGVCLVDYSSIPGKFIIKKISNDHKQSQPMTWWKFKEFIDNKVAKLISIRSVEGFFNQTF